MIVAACARVLVPGADRAGCAEPACREGDDEHHGRRDRVQVQAVQDVGAKGKVTFASRQGEGAHDFKINGKKTPLIQPGKKATLTVSFAKAGSSLTCAPFPATRPRE